MSPRILIVEDDPFIAMSLSVLLKKNKFKVIGIKDNADDAWETCLEEKPDLVLLDVRLVGEKKGIWVGQQIKDSNLPTKIIYLTAFNDKETIDAIVATEPEIYVTKPFNKSVLVSNIELILKKSNLDMLEILDNRKKLRLNTKDIQYIQSEGNYLNIYMKDRPTLVIRERLNCLEDRIINKSFTRVHQRFMVNLDWVTKAGKESVFIENEKIPVSNPYKHVITEKFKL